MRKIKTDKLITPDHVEIPEWDISYNVRIKTIVGIYQNGKLWIKEGGIHPQMWGKCGSSFDFRLLPTGELVYWGQDFPWKYFKNIKYLLDNNQFIRIGRITNIPEFTSVLVNEPDGIAQYTIDELQNVKSNIVDNSHLRLLHITNPRTKKLLIPKEQVSAEYKESCKFWEDKIGDLDVAEWHLLKYQE